MTRSEKWKATHIRNLKVRRMPGCVSFKGDNFRFVLWGGLADVQLPKSKA
jgi:hypothetical protein